MEHAVATEVCEHYRAFSGIRQRNRRKSGMATMKANELERRARAVIPGGVNSNFRKDETYHPTFIDHGRGARVVDVDGNEYIDFSLSYGPSILGHSNEHLRAAIRETADRLYSPVSSELEILAAEKLVENLPSVELVRFACSGTDATYNVLRAARAFTGRNRVVRFAGHYHGGTDEILGGIVVDPDDPTPVAGERSDDLFSIVTNTAGRARHAFDDTYIVEWNDLSALEHLFARFGEDIAAVIMEPVMVNMHGCTPVPGYLEGVRELCDRYSVVLIFDEVLTGFRVGLGGAQAHYGVMPDLCTFAKALGGGFPVSAFGGRRDIMDGFTTTEVVGGGTYNGHPLAMASVVATIEELERDGGAAFEVIDRLGTRLKEGIDEAARRHGVPLLLQGFPGAWAFTVTDRAEIRNLREGLGDGLFEAGELQAHLKAHGILTTLRFCTSAAHTDDDVDEALERIDAALADYAAARNDT